MPMLLISAPPLPDSGLHPLRRIDRPQTPPGISALTHDVEREDTQQPPAMCDNDHGAEGDRDDDIGWEEDEDMPEIEGLNGRKPSNAARIAALEGTVVEIRAVQKEQGQLLTAVQTDCAAVKTDTAKTRDDTAQILAALKSLGVGVAESGAPQQGSALSLTTPPHAALQVQVARALQALGPLGSIVVVYLLVKGYI